ncbi:creatininase family protein [Mycobacterium sp. D16R24]|uniref:creatininase family protein n=1 Tax=Mycobacterium sp. D16R24 TaxID=1855656 RepID=UPI0009925F74|nr:creatininase family protein [Mycobacterium sp. D16R24]
MTHHQETTGFGLPSTTTDDNWTNAPVALLSIGSFEQHGPYLPLATDTLIATAIAESISRQHNAFQLPTLAFGCSHEHSDFPGTVSIGATTLNSIVTDVIDSLNSQGTRGLVIVNAHGGNYVLSNVVQEANTKGQIRVGLFPSREDWTEAREAAGINSTNHDDMHAGELETSILLATHPRCVRDGWQTADHSAPDRRHLTTVGVSAYTDNGVIGYPSRASAEKGRAVLDHLGKAAGELIKLLVEPHA